MPASKKTTEERIAELEEKQKQLKAQKRALMNRAKVEERKKRTHRLIQVGAIVEKYLGTIEDLDEFEKQFESMIKKK